MLRQRARLAAAASAGRSAAMAAAAGHSAAASSTPAAAAQLPFQQLRGFASYRHNTKSSTRVVEEESWRSKPALPGTSLQASLRQSWSGGRRPRAADEDTDAESSLFHSQRKWLAARAARDGVPETLPSLHDAGAEVEHAYLVHSSSSLLDFAMHNRDRALVLRIADVIVMLLRLERCEKALMLSHASKSTKAGKKSGSAASADSALESAEVDRRLAELVRLPEESALLPTAFLLHRLAVLTHAMSSLHELGFVGSHEALFKRALEHLRGPREFEQSTRIGKMEATAWQLSHEVFTRREGHHTNIKLAAHPTARTQRNEHAFYNDAMDTIRGQLNLHLPDAVLADCPTSSLRVLPTPSFPNFSPLLPAGGASVLNVAAVVHELLLQRLAMEDASIPPSPTAAKSDDPLAFPEALHIAESLVDTWDRRLADPECPAWEEDDFAEPEEGRLRSRSARAIRAWMEKKRLQPSALVGRPGAVKDFEQRQWEQGNGDGQDGSTTAAVSHWLMSGRARVLGLQHVPLRPPLWVFESVLTVACKFVASLPQAPATDSNSNLTASVARTVLRVNALVLLQLWPHMLRAHETAVRDHYAWRDGDGLSRAVERRPQLWELQAAHSERVAQVMHLVLLSYPALGALSNHAALGFHEQRLLDAWQARVDEIVARVRRERQKQLAGEGAHALAARRVDDTLSVPEEREMMATVTQAIMPTHALYNQAMQLTLMRAAPLPLLQPEGSSKSASRALNDAHLAQGKCRFASSAAPTSTAAEQEASRWLAVHVPAFEAQVALASASAVPSRRVELLQAGACIKTLVPLFDMYAEVLGEHGGEGKSKTPTSDSMVDRYGDVMSYGSEPIASARDLLVSQLELTPRTLYTLARAARMLQSAVDLLSSEAPAAFNELEAVLGPSFPFSLLEADAFVRTVVEDAAALGLWPYTPAQSQARIPALVTIQNGPFGEELVETLLGLALLQHPPEAGDDAEAQLTLRLEAPASAPQAEESPLREVAASLLVAQNDAEYNTERRRTIKRVVERLSPEAAAVLEWKPALAGKDAEEAVLSLSSFRRSLSSLTPSVRLGSERESLLHLGLQMHLASTHRQRGLSRRIDAWAVWRHEFLDLLAVKRRQEEEGLREMQLQAQLWDAERATREQTPPPLPASAL